MRLVTLLLLFALLVKAQNPSENGVPSTPLQTPEAPPPAVENLPTPPPLDSIPKEGTSQPTDVDPASQQMPPAESGMTEMQNLVPPGESVATEFKWDPAGKRDPFRPYKIRVLQQNEETPIDPLSLLDLSQIKVVGILWNTQKPRAVIQDSTGRRFTVFKKTKIGINRGVVVEIREGEVVVIEVFDDGFGNVVKEPKVLTLNKVAPAPKVDANGNLKNSGG